MSSDRPIESESSAYGGWLIFISDASAEADRLAAAFRLAGYSVVDVPLALLPGRVAIQQPSLLICDIDAEGAVERIRALGDAPGGCKFAIVLVGERDGSLTTLSEDVAALASATFTRPLDVDDLVQKARSLVGPGSSAPAPPSIPPSLRPPLLTPSSTIPPASRRPPSRRPLTDAPELDELSAAESISVAPDASISSSRPPASHLELSAQITNLLLDAERRVAGELRGLPAGDSADDGGDESDQNRWPGAPEVTEPLPGDVLEALDESLDDQAPPSFEPAYPDISMGTQSGVTAGGEGTRADRRTGAPARPEGTSVTEHGVTGIGHAPAEGGTAIESSAADTNAERRARQEAATPKPPKPSTGTSSWPPRDEERPSTKPPSRGPTEPPERPATAPPPATVPTDIPLSMAARSLGTAAMAFPRPPPEPAIHQPPTEPPAETRDDPSTAPPPRPRRSDRAPRLASQVSTTPPLKGRPDSPPPNAGAAAAVAAPLPSPNVPEVLRDGDAIRALASGVVTRWSGGIAFEVDQGIRRVVFREGDFVTAASGVHGESLVAFLVSRGDLPADMLREAHKLPIVGRHAGAALVARGHLTQDQLWDVLRAHAEWLIGQVAGIRSGSAALEPDLPGRLKDEPSVFGGATGAEVLVEIVRRVVPPEEAATRIGGWDVVLTPGPNAQLLGECALFPEENELVAQSRQMTLAELAEAAGDRSFSAAVHALVELGVLDRGSADRAEPAAPELERAIADLDGEALRERILTRRALVQEADYFSLLGVPRSATSYDIKRAYLALRRDLDPSRALTPATVDLEDDLTEILVVIDEAYDILRDQARRERYRRAIEATR